MNSPVKIVGIVQAKNEWPLLALSISHALKYHVDKVYVLNHASTDASLAGLQKLEAIWKDRIHVVSSYDERYWQEASTNALILLSQEFSPDWIYVFDADEFLLTQDNRPLRDMLAEIDPQYSIVHYVLENWIPTREFDETNLDDYKKLRYRAIPTQSYSESTFADAQQGKVSFYDLPNPIKVIYRNRPEFWLNSGAHLIRDVSDVHKYWVSIDKIRGVHFSFISWRRVIMKAEQGRRLVKDKFPVTYGWHSHLINRLEEEKRLEWFWACHSISENNAALDSKEPKYEVDEGFITAITPILDLLSDTLTPEDLRVIDNYAANDLESDKIEVSLPSLFEAMQKIKEAKDEINELKVKCHSLYLENQDFINKSRIWRYTKILREILKRFRGWRAAI